MCMCMWYTVCESKKTTHFVNTLFWGKQKAYGYKKIKAFFSYEEAMDFGFSLKKDFVIKKELETGGGISTIKVYHYKYRG